MSEVGEAYQAGHYRGVVNMLDLIEEMSRQKELTQFSIDNFLMETRHALETHPARLNPDCFKIEDGLL